MSLITFVLIYFFFFQINTEAKDKLYTVQKVYPFDKIIC